MLRRFSLLVLVLTVSVPTFAAVSDVSPSGFMVRHVFTVSGAPDKVFDAVIRQVGGWWNPAHTYSGDSKNLSIDARAGGCFCEKLPNGGVSHMSVAFVSAGRLLRLVGGLGPLQSSGVAGSMTLSFAAVPEGTKLEVVYSVGGYMQGGFEKIAPAVDGVLGEQFARLKSFVETGAPTPATAVPALRE